MMRNACKCCAASLLAFVASASPSLAQFTETPFEADPPAQFKRPALEVDGIIEVPVTVIASPNMKSHRPQVVTRYIQETTMVPIPPEELEEAKQFASALQQYKDATDEAQKAELAAKIQKILQQQFERDLKRREEELAPVEVRVKTLRKQLDARKGSMNQIVELKFKTIINNADGLGFPDEDGRFELPASRSPNSTPNSIYSVPTPIDAEPNLRDRPAATPKIRSTRKPKTQKEPEMKEKPAEEREETRY